MQTPQEEINYLLLITSIVGAISATIGIGAFTLGLWRRSIGRRRSLSARLDRLGTGAQLSFFEATIGEPPAISQSVVAEVSEFPHGRERRAERSFAHSIFIDREFYVTTWSDADQTVLAFSITARGKRFHPTFTGVPDPPWTDRLRWKRRYGQPYRRLFRVELGRTTFAELAEQSVLDPAAEAYIAARSFSYSEIYSFGNPGHYQTYVFTASSAVNRSAGPFDELGQVMRDQGQVPRNLRDSVRLEGLSRVGEWRRRSVVSTYTVLGPTIRLEDFPIRFGPHGDEVRTLP